MVIITLYQIVLNLSHSHFDYLLDGKVETILNEDLDTTDYCTAWVKPESYLQNWVGSKTETWIS